MVSAMSVCLTCPPLKENYCLPPLLFFLVQATLQFCGFVKALGLLFFFSFFLKKKHRKPVLREGCSFCPAARKCAVSLRTCSQRRMSCPTARKCAVSLRPNPAQGFCNTDVCDVCNTGCCSKVLLFRESRLFCFFVVV